MTNLPASLRGWRANLAYIDAAHRVHARVEDAIRTGKDCGIGKFPSHLLSLNRAWFAAALTAAALLAWLRLLALDSDLAKAEPKALRPHLARRRPPGAHRPPAPPQNLRHLALGTRDRDRLAAHQRPAPSPLTSTKPSQRPRKQPRGPWNPRPPGPPAGPLSLPDPKIKIHYVTWRHSQTSDRSA